MRRNLLLLILATVAWINHQPTVYAREVHHTLFFEDWKRTPATFKQELLTCLFGSREDCRASIHIAADPAERVRRYAAEGLGMEVDELLAALDTATVQNCTGSIETMFVDEKGNFRFRTRKCKTGPNGEIEQLFVLENGADIAGPCANPNKRREVTEVPTPAAEEGPTMRMVCGDERASMPSGYLWPDNTQATIGFTPNFGAAVGSVPRWYGSSGRSCRVVPVEMQ